MSDSLTTKTKTILIVDDEEPVVKALSVRCQQLGLHVERAHNSSEALKIIHHKNPLPDLLLLDYQMPGMDGLTLCDIIRADKDLKDLPVIMLTGSDHSNVRRRCDEMNVIFVKKDVDAWGTLQPLIQQLLELEGVDAGASPAPAPQPAPAPAPAPAEPGSNNKKQKKVLIIDDDPAIVKSLQIRLQAAGLKVLAAYTGMQGYWKALNDDPNLIILDYKMPEGWGNTILGKLKTNPLTKAIPVIILSGMKDIGVQRDVVRLGAECWVDKPFEMQNFIELIQDTLLKG